MFKLEDRFCLLGLCLKILEGLYPQIFQFDQDTDLVILFDMLSD